MARGLIKKIVPLLVNGSIDTKTNPKLVQPGSLLDLQNMYQLRTGEMTPRNGFSLVPVPERALSAGPPNLFVTKNGGLGTIGNRLFGTDTTVSALRYGSGVTGREGWAMNADRAAATVNYQSYPNITAAITGLPLGNNSANTPTNVVDPDMAIVGGAQHAAWTNGVDLQVFSDLRDPIDGRAVSTAAALQPTIVAIRPPLVASTGGNWGALFYSSAANHLDAIAHNPVSQTTTSLALAVDLAASPFFDVKAIPGTSKFAVAYKANAGGIKCGIYDPAASTFTSVVATGAADASLCLGWLDDSFATGSMYLATVGAGPGLVVRIMSATTMAVSSTRTIDAGATANVRNVTGHLSAATPKYTVLWDVAGATTIFDGTKVATWDGTSVTLGGFSGGPHSLYSRSVKFPDGKYRVLGCFISLSGQSMYSLLICDTHGLTNPGGDVLTGFQCHILQGEAAARRSACSLMTPVLSGNSVIMIMARARSIIGPDGSKAAPITSASVATFTVMSTVTHAREIGGTVFLPGGVINRDDGASFEPATFPIYPEVPTGSSSATGSMTASGAYSYRVVFRTNDAQGRATWSAGSVPFAITLGAGDGRVSLTVWGLSWVRGDVGLDIDGFGKVIAEIYRRGPAASGATLYNKVGEVNASTPLPTGTISFLDTMSDANAALGQVAYFNGNVLENFNPPSHTVLEVNGNRVGLINAEDTSEFWFSKEYKGGTGIGFNPLLKVAISGDGAGGLTALAAMDGRWILFKRSAIYVLSGDGPNDLGQGSFNAPQAVSRTIGTINPASVIETPDGIMFQAQTGGMWLLSRGMELSYIGSPIEELTNFNPTGIAGASLSGGSVGSGLPGMTARFVISDSGGTMLEWDYFHKRWYVHFLRTDGGSVVGCVNSPLFGWCYMLDSGTVMKETLNQTADVNGTTTAIIPLVSFPHLDFAGLAGYQRLYTIDFTVEGIGAGCTLSVGGEYNYGTATTPKTIAIPGAGAISQVQYTPPEGRAKGTSVRPFITVSGTPTGGTFKLTAATATIGIKRGSNIAAAGRMT